MKQKDNKPKIAVAQFSKPHTTAALPPTPLTPYPPYPLPLPFLPYRSSPAPKGRPKGAKRPLLKGA